MTERTFVMLKPSAVSRGLVGEILTRFEKRGFKIVALKTFKMSHAMAERLYKVHEGKPFYNDLIGTISGKKVVVAVLEGRGAVGVVRKMVGSTDPTKAEPGTIRGDFGLEITDNVIHASDSQETYEYEWKIFFGPDEALD